MDLEGFAIVDPSIAVDNKPFAGRKPRQARSGDTQDPVGNHSNVDPAVRGRQTYGQTEFGGIQASIARVNSKDNLYPEARTSPHGNSGHHFDLRTIYRKSSDVRMETSRTSSKQSRDSPKFCQPAARRRSSSFRGLLSCLGRPYARSEGTSMKSRGSSQDLSFMARRSSLDMNSSRSGVRHSFDDPIAVGSRYRRMSTELRRDSLDLGYPRRPRRNSVDHREADGTGFLDRAFENAIGINLSDDEDDEMHPM